MATFSAQSVATELRRRLPNVPIKKLHKLLYYCQAHHLATFDEPLFGETISAWDMGPVVGQLWYAETQHGQAIASDAALGEPELNTIGYVVSRYGRLSGAELERLTHSEAPWIEADARRRAAGLRSEKISIRLLQSYFADQAAEDETTDVPIDQAQIDAWLKGVEGRSRSDFSFDSMESLAARRR